jgi:hypothetical protein
MGITGVINITIDTTGLEKKLDKLQFKLPQTMTKVVLDSAEFIHEKAMQNLYNDLVWGSSLDPEQQIKNTKEINILEITPTKISAELRYTSPHSAIVEYGGFGTITAKEHPLAVGKQQFGFPLKFAEEVQFQQGKFFLTKACLENMDGIYNIARKNVDDLIKSL